MTRATRLISLNDAPALETLLRVNREFLAPWEPVRPDDYVTLAGQQAVIGDVLARYRDGSAVPHVIVDSSGRVVGRITLNGTAPAYLEIAGRWQDHHLYQLLNPAA